MDKTFGYLKEITDISTLSAFEKIHLDHFQSRAEHYASLCETVNLTAKTAIIENTNGAQWIDMKFFLEENLIFKFQHYLGIRSKIDDSEFKEAIRRAEIVFVEDMIAMVLNSLAHKDDLSRAVISAMLNKSNENTL